MKRALDIILKKSLILSQTCFRFVWLLCTMATQMLVNLILIVSVIVFAVAAILIVINIPKLIAPSVKAPINEAELQLIEKNSRAFEENIVKKCTVSKEYSFNELVPFEWEKVYFINALKEVNVFFGVDYVTDWKKIINKAGYDWGGEIPNLIDYSGPSEHTHILFLNDGKVVAYLPYNFKSKPVIVCLRHWGEGVFESCNNPKFFVKIDENNIGDKTFVLTQ